MIPFKRANILLPKNVDMTKWSVVACDQYTSEMEYWDDVYKIVGDNPSTLKITLPEIFLEDSDVNERINKINDTMKEYLDEDLFYELKENNISVERQKKLPIIYKGFQLDTDYRIDLLIDNQLIIELKSVETLQPVHSAQLLTYMKLSNLKYGLLLNFNVPHLKQGIKRFIL